MEKQADGFWTVTTPPLVPGLHYYSQHRRRRGQRPGQPRVLRRRQARERRGNPRARLDYYSIQDVPHGQVREVWYHSKVTGSWRHALVYLPPDYDAKANGALSGALPAARRRRRRDRLDPAGQRKLHPRQLDRGGKAQADDRRDGVRLCAPGGRSAGGHLREAVRSPRRAGPRGDGAGIRRRRDAGADSVRRQDVRTLADRDHRAMAGLSMGGIQTFQITLKTSICSRTSADSAASAGCPMIANWI